MKGTRVATIQPQPALLLGALALVLYFLVLTGIAHCLMSSGSIAWLCDTLVGVMEGFLPRQCTLNWGLAGESMASSFISACASIVGACR